MLFAFFQGQAQDKIELLNGKDKSGYFQGEDDFFIYYSKDEDGKQKKIDRLRVFRVIKNSSDSVFQYDQDTAGDFVKSNIYLNSNDTFYVYVQDTAAENDFSIEQIEMHIAGQQDARKLYKPWKNAVGGFCVGGASSFLGFFWSFLPSGAYVTLNGTWKVNEDKFKVTNEENKQDEVFREGYGKVVRAKRIKYSGLGTLAGIISGIVTYQLLLEE